MYSSSFYVSQSTSIYLLNICQVLQRLKSIRLGFLPSMNLWVHLEGCDKLIWLHNLQTFPEFPEYNLESAGFGEESELGY